MSNMKNKFLNLCIVNIDGKKYKFEALYLTIRTILGYMGICYGHAPLISTIIPSVLSIKQINITNKAMYISGGIIEILNNNVIVLADIIERPENMDENNIAKEFKKANLAYRKSINSKNMNFQKASLIQAETLARLETIKRFKKFK